jgi:hypothetical protein
MDMDRPQSYYGRAPADRSHVDVADPLELRWWCGRFGCSDLRLIQAIAQVGTAPSQVEQFLRFSASFDARTLSKPGTEEGRRKTRRRGPRHAPMEAPALASQAQPEQAVLERPGQPADETESGEPAPAHGER